MSGARGGREQGTAGGGGAAGRNWKITPIAGASASGAADRNGERS
ncbi:hypothetical protein [Nonomuraea longicatena]